MLGQYCRLSRMKTVKVSHSYFLGVFPRSGNYEAPEGARLVLVAICRIAEKNNPEKTQHNTKSILTSVKLPAGPQELQTIMTLSITNF